VIWLAIPALAAAAYYLLALIAAANQSRDREGASFTPPISILKPIHGRDPHLYDALLSHAAQSYPTFEILSASATPTIPPSKTSSACNPVFRPSRFRFTWSAPRRRTPKPGCSRN
jgi:hypothetical protein